MGTNSRTYGRALRSTLHGGMLVAWAAWGIAALAIAGCSKQDQTSGTNTQDSSSGLQTPHPAGPAVDVTFVYGSEKKNWINDVTDAFNRSGQKTAGGKTIYVKPVPMGSGEAIAEVLEGRTQADVLSPASSAFITLGNAQSRAQGGKDLVGDTQNLVLSPVVIAMWRPMAEALGWPAKPVGWAEILSLTKEPNGWGSKGHAEWGRFKFGHTHPEYSNSGLISVLAEAYAGTGKQNRLTLEDTADPKVGAFVGEIESAVVHYGSSTGFFSDKMYANGPGYLSAAVLYENLVIESYGGTTPTAMPVVAVYPREGTFWSDHPAGIVQRDWVTPERKEAAQAYIKFLLDRPQQEKALVYGFRPGDPSLPLGSPIDAAHGVDPSQPKTTLEVPSADVTTAVISLWRTHKKRANVVLVLDTSGSMNEGSKLPNAKLGANQLIDLLNDDDTLSLLPFSTDYHWVGRGTSMKSGRGTIKGAINSLIADGSTKLYDSIAVAYQDVTVDNPHPDQISAVVVLTDGEDTARAMTLDGLLAKIHPDEEHRPVRIFTIGYGNDARADVLKRIADETRAKFFKGTPENIREVFKEIATFF